ncbi:MAG: COP23 domain-containing protein [Pseudanabaenaceae cyanobacterium]
MSWIALGLSSGLLLSQAGPVPVDSFPSPDPLPPVPGPVETVGQTGGGFSCQFANGRPEVSYQPPSQPGRFYPWAAPGQMGGGWSPEQRCFEIARRLEAYRADGLTELRTGVENGYNVVCATTERNPLCRIVFTVPVGADPLTIRDRVFENLLIADSGQGTIAVNTLRANSQPRIFRSRAAGINLRPFLDVRDGGTLNADSAASRPTPSTTAPIPNGTRNLDRFRRR